MTWTATSGQNTLISDNGNLTNVVLNNGTTTLRLVDVPNDGTAAGLAAGVKARVASRDATSGVRQFVAIGTVLDLTTPVAPPPPSPQPPDPAVIARQVWFANYASYLSYKIGLNEQFPGLDAATLQTMHDNLVSSWDASYVDGLMTR